MVRLNINGRRVDADVEPDTPLLWVLRDTLGLTGTKFGCGAGLCGACSVHVDGKVMRSCMIAAGQLQGKEIATIESIAAVPKSSGRDRVDRRTGAPMWLLSIGADHGRHGVAATQSKSFR